MHIILWVKYLEENIGSEMLKGGFTPALLLRVFVLLLGVFLFTLVTVIYRRSKQPQKNNNQHRVKCNAQSHVCMACYTYAKHLLETLPNHIKASTRLPYCNCEVKLHKSQVFPFWTKCTVPNLSLIHISEPTRRTP